MCSFPPWPPGPRQGWAAGSDRFWLLELRVSRHFSTFYGPSVQAMDTQLGARHRRPPPTIRRGSAQRTIFAGSWFGQGLLTLPEPAQQIREERKHASTATLQHARATQV